MGVCVVNQYVFTSLKTIASTGLCNMPTCIHNYTVNWLMRVFHDGGSSFTGCDKRLRYTGVLEYDG
ncbi:hypothetical protein M747DRAFT_295391 [Aspergillus niger ATCC 13496]|nr:hypothetical protein M747DRAFT_295391 [Aspergillus niger ATCC 13496]